MKNRSPGQPCVVSNSRVRRSALVGAAATALIAVSPSLHAAAVDAQAATLQAAVRNALRMPVRERVRVAGAWDALNAGKVALADSRKIEIGNVDPITVGPDQTALGASSVDEDIVLVNSGDLTGGIGIDVSTGALDPDAVLYSVSFTSGPFNGNYAPIYDDAGNPIVQYGYPVVVPTATYTTNANYVVFAPDSRASTIRIDNRGSVAFSGSDAIRATNPAGQSIDIVNSGDITATADTNSRAGIYASTEVFGYTTRSTKTADGEFTYNANGQLTGVVAPDEFEVDRDYNDMVYDGGAISIRNDGDIDMGAVSAPPADPFGSRRWSSAGIYTRGDGGTEIVNTGDITVDRWSAGIHAVSTAATSISNSGRIEIGNYSTGISFAPSKGEAGYYRLGGDVEVLNDGEIRGGIDKDATLPGEEAFVTGIGVASLGSNNADYAALGHYNELFAGYNEILGSEVFPLFDVPNLRLYDTTVVNRGSIELLDGATGIFVSPAAGTSTVVNEGRIVVGDGASIAAFNNERLSAGILQANRGGLGPTISVNSATGVIVTGDEGAGIWNQNSGGDSIAINEGSITTGNGVATSVTNYYGETYDRLFQSFGIRSINQAPARGASAYALNSGEISVGELALGILVSGQGIAVLDPATPTGVGVNDGSIATGDNSSGMLVVGTNTLVVNSGSVAIGDLDLGAFTPLPLTTGDEFAQLGVGLASWGFGTASLANYGNVATGNGTVGAFARTYVSGFPYAVGYGYNAQLLQNADGVITTGDDSVGALVVGNTAAALVNEGRVTTGDASIGVDVAAGNAVVRYYGELAATVIEGELFVSNSGIVETGDGSIGVRVAGAKVGVEYSGTVKVLLPDPVCNPYYCVYQYDFVEVAGEVDVIGTSYLVNTGAIRTGAGSTAVEITGEAADERGLQLFNAGSIQAGPDGTGVAIRINDGNDIDSYVVNVGSIAGDVIFGSGDDRLVNTLSVDAAGRVTSTGNITMNGSVIDFGGGDNRFEVDQGVITVAGGDNLVTGADLILTQATIDARSGAAGSTLTLDGNLTGSFTFATDLAAGGADRLVIGGDVADGSDIGVVLNPTEQLKGDFDFTVISFGGENANAPLYAGATGRFADSIVRAEANLDAASGDVVVSTRFGMGHMAIAAASATTMAQNWWLQSVESFDKRNLHRLSGADENGIAVWSSVFHEEGTILPDNALQNVDFDQKVSALQAGVQWTGEIGGGRVSAGPIVGQGDARANPNANVGSARGDVNSYGLNASYVLEQGLYVDASWQKMTMDTDLRTPGTASGAKGRTDADGDGWNLETGYSHRLASGLVLVPQIQYASVDVELDDFTSSDGTYGFTDVGGEATLLRAGVAVLRTFETDNGFITPMADLNFLDFADGDSALRSNGVGFANDTSGSGYRAEFGIAGRYKAWDITGRVGVTDTSASDYLLSTNIAVRYRW
jgi:outer membrane autotransporter protein